jgi:uncharacterized repeat protein (TIGR03803 family)
MRTKGLASLPLLLAALILLPLWEGNASGSTEKVLYSFNGTIRHGSEPSANLTADASGNLYGTTDRGGDFSLGTVYKLTPNSGSATQTVLHSFKGGSDGAHPFNSGVILDTLGNLYGVTYNGGTGACSIGGQSLGCGTVFELSPNSNGGWTESILYSFQGGSDGALPQGGLIFDSGGILYGTTIAGGGTGVGNNCCGTVFKLSPVSGGGWTESVLYHFTGGTDGSSPSASLVFDGAGNLYGTTIDGGALGLGVVFELTPSSKVPWTENVLYSFAGGSDGAYPSSRLIFDSAANLYGTTRSGGSKYDDGTVFELKSNGNGSWTESVLHRFSGSGVDGISPAGLIFDHAGNLYGTTTFGGIAACYSNSGCGVVFELTPGSGGLWTESILHTFGGGADGGNPYYDASLIFDQEGNLYGTTAYGGRANLGTVFKLSPNGASGWTKSTIYSFLGGGSTSPYANLVFDGSGNLYGTASNGGAYQNGAAFKMTPNSSGGWTTSLIHSFNGKDGAYPSAGLIFDSAGNLYGTTSGGGANSCSGSGCGVVFKLAPSSSGKWIESVLYSFKGVADGQWPAAGLVFDKQGNLFGTTYAGGGGGTGCNYYGCGVVFELTPTGGGLWTERVLYTFTGGSDNGEPYYGSLALDATGNLYGTTSYTGCDGCTGYYSTVFKISPNGIGAWTQSVIYTFTDGSVPFAGLTLDAAGNLYGTTAFILYDNSNAGTVFELKPSGGGWTESTLYSFTGARDGGTPIAGVVFDAAGNLYGTTSGGGNACSPYNNGCGVVYKLAPGSGGQWTYGLLHTFNGLSSDGAVPYAGVILDNAGNLYGTTEMGGSANQGVVFEVTP